MPNAKTGEHDSAARPILVTGAAGFIGSHLVRRLIRDGHSVAVLLRPGEDTGRITDLLPRLRVLRADLTDQAEVARALHDVHPYGVFHLGALLTQIGVATPAEDFVRVNALGTIGLIEALAGTDYRFFIHAGTSFEYGAKSEPLREDDTCEPVTAYGIAKLAASLYCRSVARASGKPIVVIRLFTPYGPGMGAGKLMDVVVRNALRNEDLRLTSPEVNRDFIFIDDAIELFIEAMGKSDELKGEIFNLGSGKAVTLGELVELVLAMTGSKSKVLWGDVKQPPYDSGCQEANMTKTLASFSWRPTHDLREGIGKMIEAVKAGSQ